MEAKRKPPKSLNDLLDRMGEVAEEKDEVSMREVMDAVGKRSFGPLLLVLGVIGVAPGIGDIPGVATIMGVLVLTVSAQILAGRRDLWLPKWVLNRTVASKRIRKMARTRWLRKPAGWIDRVVSERLEALTGPKATFAIAASCTAMALALPLTEFVPLSTAVLCTGLLAYGLSLVANDGLMALLGFAISAATVVLLVMGWT